MGGIWNGGAIDCSSDNDTQMYPEAHCHDLNMKT
jgi:hypothetical protein